MISADLSHSLTRILPASQRLLPVSFKRKLCYTGSFIEEIIDRKKILAYFEFFKKHNHLFQNVVLNQNLIDKYEMDILKQTEDEITSAMFRNSQDDSNSLDQNNSQSNGSSDEDSTAKSGSSIHSNSSKEENINDEIHYERHIFKDQTTVLCNKYESDVKGKTVANRLANIIVLLENSAEFNPSRNDHIFRTNYENSDINDEINLEEIDEFLDYIKTEEDVPTLCSSYESYKENITKNISLHERREHNSVCRIFIFFATEHSD